MISRLPKLDPWSAIRRLRARRVAYFPHLGRTVRQVGRRAVGQSHDSASCISLGPSSGGGRSRVPAEAPCAELHEVVSAETRSHAMRDVRSRSRCTSWLKICGSHDGLAWRRRPNDGGGCRSGFCWMPRPHGLTGHRKSRRHIALQYPTHLPQAADSNFLSDFVLGTGSTDVVEYLVGATGRGYGRLFPSGSRWCRRSSTGHG